jgi:hypothetical protein
LRRWTCGQPVKGRGRQRVGLPPAHARADEPCGSGRAGGGAADALTGGGCSWDSIQIDVGSEKEDTYARWISTKQLTGNSANKLPREHAMGNIAPSYDKEAL